MGRQVGSAEAELTWQVEREIVVLVELQHGGVCVPGGVPH